VVHDDTLHLREERLDLAGVLLSVRLVEGEGREEAAGAKQTQGLGPSSAATGVRREEEEGGYLLMERKMSAAHAVEEVAVVQPRRRRRGALHRKGSDGGDGVGASFLSVARRSDWSLLQTEKTLCTFFYHQKTEYNSELGWSGQVNFVSEFLQTQHFSTNL
jgi:hypothetical protein